MEVTGKFALFRTPPTTKNQLHESYGLASYQAWHLSLAAGSGVKKVQRTKLQLRE